MLLEQEKEMLLEVLKWDDASEAVGFLVKRYSEMSVHHARALLTLIPKVVDEAMGQIGKAAAANEQAAFWLMCQREMKPDNSEEFFASMLPVCMVMFPSGKPKGRSKAEMNYWNLFVKLLRNPKIFSWEEDQVWADHHGYTDYLKLVESQLKEGAE